MKRVASYLVLTALMMTASACTDVRSASPATAAEREAARGLLRQLSTLVAHPEAAAELVTATDAAPLVSLLAPEGTPLPTVARYQDAADMNSDCISATPTAAMFNLCEIGAHAIEGTWSIEGHRVHAELVDVFVSGPESHGSVAVDTHLELGAGVQPRLTGALDANIIWSTASDDLVLDASVRIDDLTFDGPDCASGGTITIMGTITGTGAGTGAGAPGDGQRTTTSLWFGPGCSDIQISR